MASDLLWLIARCNLVMGVAIVAVLVLRTPARRWFGARIAYALWLIPPLAGATCLAPPRVEHVLVAAGAMPGVAAPAALDGFYPPNWPTDWSMPALWFWGGGAFLFLAVLALRQNRFAQSLGRLAPRKDLGARVFAAQSSAHGPAVLGVLRPMIVTPADFERRFSDDQRRIVLAHEHAHMAQGDPLINAFAALLQCLNWFNPLVHVAARALRLDQELACDAAVLAGAEGARRSYAEAILKTQIPHAAIPLGCAWPSPNLSALKERIAMLKRNSPSRTQRLLGASAIALASFGACAVAWSAQPARIVVTTAPTTPTEPITPLSVISPPSPITPVSLIQPEIIHQEDFQLEGAAGPEDDADDNVDDARVDAHPNHEPLFTSEERRVINERGSLTPAEQARIDERVRQAMERQHDAMDRQRDVMEHQRGAIERQREAMRRAERVTRDVRRRVEISDHNVAVRMTPEMRAEIHAISAAATRVAVLARTSAQSAEIQAAHAELEAHTARLGELAEQARSEAERTQERN